MQYTTENNFLRKRYTGSIAFAVAVLLFLLPFVEIRCNGMTVASNTGIGLATGQDYKLGAEMKDMQKRYGNRDNDEATVSKNSGELYAFALAALLLGIAGLIFTFIRLRSGIPGMLMGLLGGLALIALMIQIQADIKKNPGDDTSEFSKSLEVSARFTFWYYLSLLSFFAAAFFSYKYGQLQSANVVPKDAPQLDLQNPGDQSEFPKSASESELG